MILSKDERINAHTELVSKPEPEPDTLPPLTLRTNFWLGLITYVGVYSVLFWLCVQLKTPPMFNACCTPLLAAFASMLITGRKQSERAKNLTLSTVGLELHQKRNPSQKNIAPWSSLKLVGLVSSEWTTSGLFNSFSKFKKRNQLVVFNFSGIPDVTIDLNGLSEAQQHHLFRIISRCVPQSALKPEILYMQVQSLLGNTPSVDGFTQIWSQEFDRRFELANHITLAPGKSLGSGRYTVELTVATRMSSSTYLVSSKDGRKFFIKELVVPVGVDDVTRDKILEQFNREATILASLSHPSIVAVLDHFVENDRSYMVMECAQGANLRAYVRSGQPVDKRTITSIAAQTLEVLKYLHEQDPPVLHRDITPDNIVYSAERNTLKVVDFGAANIYKSQGTGTLIGKRSYMPPEQFKGKATPASDVYAFGSTLMFLLTNEDPPGMSKSPNQPENVDSQLFALAQSCLAFEQEDRPSVDYLIATFNRLSKEPEVSANV